MSKYEAVIRFDSSNAPDLLKLVDTGVQVVDLKACEQASAPQIKMPANAKVVSGQRRLFRKGKLWSSTGVNFLRGVFADGKVHRVSDLIELYMAQGYKKNSISPRLTELTKRGEVVALGEGKYQMPRPSIDARSERKLLLQHQKHTPE